MIDEKKIKEARTSYAKKTWNHMEEIFVAMCGFKEGAEWAQQEFIKSLWHDASEEPKICNLLVGWDADGYSIYYWKSQEDTWEQFVDNCKLYKWMYISDVLLHEGGKQ